MIACDAVVYYRRLIAKWLSIEYPDVEWPKWDFVYLKYNKYYVFTVFCDFSDLVMETLFRHDWE